MADLAKNSLVFDKQYGHGRVYDVRHGFLFVMWDSGAADTAFTEQQAAARLSNATLQLEISKEN